MTDQWILNRRNFEGCWQGVGRWFERQGHQPIDWDTPSRVIDPTRYLISFSDPDTGLWDGSGLFFAPEGKAQYPIRRSTYNAGGGCWQFEGAGGQSSRRIDPDQSRFGHEINLFQGRSRSMLVLIWIRSSDQWLLQLVGAVGFRCSNAAKHEPERPTCGTPNALLDPLRGWKGSMQRLIPGVGVELQPSAPRSLQFDPEQLLIHPCSVVMADGLVFSVPEQLPRDDFRLEVGGLLGPELFQQVSILFNASGELTAWERRRFQPDWV